MFYKIITVMLAYIVIMSPNVLAQDIETDNCKYNAVFDNPGHEGCVTIKDFEGECDIKVYYTDCLVATYHLSKTTYDKYNGTTFCAFSPINKVVTDDKSVAKP